MLPPWRSAIFMLAAAGATTTPGDITSLIKHPFTDSLPDIDTDSEGHPVTASLAERLVAVRHDAKLKQIPFAKSLGISQSALVTYERAERDPPVCAIIALCNTYDVRADWILHGIGARYRGPDQDIYEQVYLLEQKYPLPVTASPAAQLRHRILLHRYIAENGGISDAMLDTLIESRSEHD